MPVAPEVEPPQVALELLASRPSRPDRLTRDDWRRLFAEIAEGNHEAVAALYRAIADRIFGLALWRVRSDEDACDVVQEVFLRLVGHRDRLRRVADPRAWLFALAHHVAVDLARHRRRRPTEGLDELQLVGAAEHDEARAIDAAHASRLLGRIPAAQREAIYLRHFDDCSFAEIGRITGVPTFTAASRYRLGIARLRRLMEEP